MLYESREGFIKLFNDYSLTMSEVKYKTKHGEGLKILTPKQILQRLLIALTQVKAGNTSENLLNEIRRIIYSLYQTREIAKKVYKNNINLIKVFVLYFHFQYYIHEFWKQLNVGSSRTITQPYRWNRVNKKR